MNKLKKKILLGNLFVLLVLPFIIPFIPIAVFLEIILPIVIGLLLLCNLLIFFRYYVLGKFKKYKKNILEGQAEQILQVVEGMNLMDSGITSIHLCGGLETNQIEGFKSLLKNSKITNVTILNLEGMNQLSEDSYKNLVTALDGTKVTSLRYELFQNVESGFNPFSVVKKFPDNITHVDLFIKYINNIIQAELEVIKNSHNITSIGIDSKILDLIDDDTEMVLEKIFNDDLQKSNVTSVRLDSIACNQYPILAKRLNENAKISRLVVDNFHKNFRDFCEGRQKMVLNLVPATHIQKLVLNSYSLELLSTIGITNFLKLFPSVTEVKIVDDNGKPAKSKHDDVISTLMEERKALQKAQANELLNCFNRSSDVAEIAADYLGLSSSALETARSQAVVPPNGDQAGSVDEEKLGRGN